jgi:predicted NBD/HSP70 family sugar kinase
VKIVAYNSHIFKRHLILNITSHLGPVSRTELIELTDYRPASVTDIIKELLDERLIMETGSVSVGHGRKRTMLEINKGHLCAIGISFSNDSVSYVLSRIDGTILTQQSRRFHLAESRAELIGRITEDVQKLLEQFSDKLLVGIGISEPLFDPTAYQYGSSLTANYTHFNDWIHLSLKPQLEEITGLQVESYSGVTLPAMAEQRFGAARGVQNFICVELSNGIGSSICCNGLPVSGANGMAGELGHTVVEYGTAKRRLCYCGKPDCVEVDTAFPALVAAIMDALDSGVFSSLVPGQPITVQSIRQALDAGDRMCMHYVRQAAQKLGVVIANAVNLLNPELVVLHGFMLELGDYFLNHLEQSLRENVLAISANFALRVSDSMDALLPLGAVAEIFSSYLRSDDYKWVYQLNNSDTGGKQ